VCGFSHGECLQGNRRYYCRSFGRHGNYATDLPFPVPTGLERLQISVKTAMVKKPYLFGHKAEYALNTNG
jgi:hypothetical protein